MKDCNALVSIIVPVYGTEAYLPACIDSLCSQTYSNIQIILVDDQSPDQCPEICDAYAKKDARIHVIHQENKGVSGARNTGMRHAEGDYMMFVDSDDELLPNAVEILMQDAYEYDADIVSSNIKTVDKDGKIVDLKEDGKYMYFQDDEPLLLLLDEDPSSHSACAKLFKTNFVKAVQFEEGKNINEDGFFMFQCYMRKPFLVRHNVLVYQYNIRADSCSRQKFSDKYLSMLYFCDKKKELIASHYPQYINKTRNMEMLTHLQLLDILCSSTDKKYKELEKQCIAKVRELRPGHKPFNKHYAELAWIVAHGLYPLYKKAIRFKYYR